jgi:hypothetical protein
MDYDFARAVLGGANKFTSVVGTDTWRREVLNLTHLVTIVIEVAPADDGKLAVTATLKDRESRTVRRADKDYGEIYVEALAWAHPSAG